MVRETGFRRAPCIPYLVVVSLSHPNGPQVIVGSTAKVVMLRCFALRVCCTIAGRDQEHPVVEIGKSREHEGKGEMGMGPSRSKGTIENKGKATTYLHQCCC